MKRRMMMVMSLLTMMTAWGKSIDVAEWTEEVKLSDGRLITVWRRARAYSGGWPNSKRGRDIDFEFKYAPLGIYWKGDWNRYPMSFEIIDGAPYLVLYISDKASCANRPKTDYSAQFLRWQNGQWVEVRQVGFPVQRALINLSIDFWGHTTVDDYKGQIAWDVKKLPGDSVKEILIR